MAETDKSLGLHQRIPMDILLEAFKAEITEEQDLERLSELINTEYAGENRQKKGFRQVKTTLADNRLVELSKARKDEVMVALKSAAVELGFVDRFSGSLIITGTVSEVEASEHAILDYVRENLKYTTCGITKT